MTLGYTLPESVTNKIGLTNLRLYVTGINILTFTNDYPWYDPETSSGNDVIVGWDRGNYPNNKSWTVGLQVKL